MANNQGEYYRGAEAAGCAIAAAGSGDAAAVAAAVHTGLEALLRDTPAAARRACHRGCDSCCHYPVGVTFGEAVLLARAVGADARLRERVLVGAAATAGVPWHDLVGTACPLLVGGACAAYAVRPLPCRALASRDDVACGRALAAPATAEVPRDEAAFWRGLGAAAALAGTNGLGTRELRAAVAALLALGETAAAFTRARPAG